MGVCCFVHTLQRNTPSRQCLNREERKSAWQSPQTPTRECGEHPQWGLPCFLRIREYFGISTSLPQSQRTLLATPPAASKPTDGKGSVSKSRENVGSNLCQPIPNNAMSRGDESGPTTLQALPCASSGLPSKLSAEPQGMSWYNLPGFLRVACNFLDMRFISNPQTQTVLAARLVPALQRRHPLPLYGRPQTPPIRCAFLAHVLVPGTASLCGPCGPRCKACQTFGARVHRLV